MNPRIPVLLANAAFFRGLSPDGRRALASIAIPRVVRRRDVLFAEGDRGHSMYLLARGRVQLHKTAPDGREAVVRVLRPGEVFAEVVLFESDAFPVTAVALTEAEIVLFPKRDIHRLLAEEAFRRDFLGMMMMKLRYLAERVFQISTMDVEDRLLRFLHEEGGGQPVFQLAMSKKDIAAAIATTPETLSRLIAKLAGDGRVIWKGRSVRLLPKAGPPGPKPSPAPRTRSSPG